jgi:hypothetical protein
MSVPGLLVAFALGLFTGRQFSRTSTARGANAGIVPFLSGIGNNEHAVSEAVLVKVHPAVVEVNVTTQ